MRGKLLHTVIARKIRNASINYVPVRDGLGMLLFWFCLFHMIVLKLEIQICSMYYYRRLKFRGGTSRCCGEKVVLLGV